MPCALEINSNRGFKLERVQSSSSTTKSISPLPQCLWPPNLAGWKFTVRGSHPLSHMTLWSLGLARTRYKLKLYLYYHIAYGHKTWQNVNLNWMAPAHKVTWLLDHLFSRHNLKPFYLYYHSGYGHQTLHDGGLLWVTLHHKVTWPFDYVVLRGHMLN